VVYSLALCLSARSSQADVLSKMAEHHH